MPATDSKLKVFISYSRHDLIFADRLVDALKMREFEVMIDRQDLPTFEDWQRELLGLIRAADSIVLLVSPHSLASKVVAWEVEQVRLHAKRLAPVVIADVESISVPPEISRINYFYFIDGTPFEQRADELARALNTDVSWLKDHTRIAELARRWTERGRSEDALIHGRELVDAMSWATRRPRQAADVTEQQVEFLISSMAGAFKPISLLNVIGFLAFIPGLLSIVSLIKTGLELRDFYTPFQRMLDGYHFVLNYSLGWAEPFLQGILNFIQNLTTWRIKLDPSWKHIFVLMMLFFRSFVRALGRSDRKTAVIVWVMGIAVSLGISVCLGVWPNPQMSSDPFYILLNAFVIAVPLTVIVLFFAASAIRYAIIQARIQKTVWWKVFIARPAIPFAVGGLAVVVPLVALWFTGVIGNLSADVLLLQPLLHLPRPLVVGLGFVLVAALFLVWAAVNAFPYARESGTSWGYEFVNNVWTSVALSMFIVLVGALVFLAFNALALSAGLQ